MKMYEIPMLPLSFEVETREILKQANCAARKLAELRGVVQTIPNAQILINTLAMQEAKESSEVENIITTQDEIYRAGLGDKLVANAAAKEVLNYRSAILHGFELVRQRKVLTSNMIREIQAELLAHDAGFRRVPGTKLLNNLGETVYTPPQDFDTINRLMSNLETFANTHDDDLDPLVKMAIIHHQFESIHPFLDGNGRTGRIINILYLVLADCLDLPILYLSRYITRNKAEYYRTIQAIRNNAPDNEQQWREWIIFMLKGVEQTAEQTIELVKSVAQMMREHKHLLRNLLGKQYRQELLNNLFFHPYTKIEFVEKALLISRQTAAKYLKTLTEAGVVECLKIGKSNYYINTQLCNLFLNANQ